ncbi:MAG: trigger factor [Clostridiales bacterium]|nr:trigger factor [Clostridiales bacterium]
MTLTKSEKTEGSRYELQFKIEPDVFEAAVNRAYRKNIGKINIPGFRRGKAPRSIVEKMYGKGFFYEDAINELLPDNYEEAVRAAGIEPVGRPEFDVVSIDENGLVLKAVVYVKPEIEIEGYKGIEATKVPVVVTDDEVDHEIEHVRKRNAREIDITDRPAQTGDIVNIDYEGSIDGVPFEGGSDEGHILKLGSGYFIPGFEDQIVGHSVGDEFDVNVTFPEKYHKKDLEGKPAVFKVKLNSIKYEELPALDDEFAKDVSEFDTFDEYRADMKAKITERKEKDADAAVEAQLVDRLVEIVKGDIPEPYYEAETENILRDYDMRLRSQGLDLSTYLKYTGQTLDQLRAQMRPTAIRQVKTRFALEKIAEIENIEVSDEEVEAEYSRMASLYSVELEKVKEAIPADDIKADLRLKKAIELVKAAAVVTEKQPEDNDEKASGDGTEAAE